MITAAILSVLDENFSSPVDRTHAEDALSDATDLPGRRSIKDMRRALDRILLRVRKLRPDFSKIEKGPHTRDGLHGYALRTWSALILLEKVNPRLDFTAGALWLIDDLPLEPIMGVRKLDGSFIIRVPSGTHDVDQPVSWGVRIVREVKCSKCSSVIREAGYVSGPSRALVRVCSECDTRKVRVEQVADPTEQSANERPEVEPVEVEPPHVWESTAKLQALGLLDSSEWTMSGAAGLEMVGINRAGLARIVNALDRGPEPIAERSAPNTDDLEGFWMVEYQGQTMPAEVCHDFDQTPPSPVVYLPGVGSERDLDQVKLLWRIKVWTQGEIMIQAGQLLSDHGIRPASFRAFVSSLIEMIGGVA